MQIQPSEIWRAPEYGPLYPYTNILRASAPPRETSPTYDADGNMTWDGKFAYAWDAENRLIAASNETLRLDYAYDPQSRRVAKRVYAWDTDHWSLITDHSFLYDGWNLVRETVATRQGVITNHYVWGIDLGGTLQGAGGVGGLLAVSIDGAWHFPLYDNNGNVTAYADESGALAAEYAYDAFGRTIAHSGPMADAFPHCFSTKYFDSETGLYYYGYRFYAPDLMRWMNRDPIGEKGGENLFSALQSPELPN